MRSFTIKQRRQLVALVAASGSLANLEVSLEHAGCVPTAAMMEAAAAAGQLDACKLLRERGGPCGNAFDMAAKAGHLAVCEWLLAADAVGRVSTRAATANAAIRDHVGLMNSFPPHPTLCTGEGSPSCWLLPAVAEGRDLAALQQHHRQEVGDQLPLQYDQLAGASVGAGDGPRAGWQAGVEVVEELGGPDTPADVYRAAAALPDAVARLTWMRAWGYPADESAADAAEGTSSTAAALRCLLEPGGRLPAGHPACEAGSEDDPAILQVLHAHGYDVRTPYFYRVAAAKGHLPTVAWMVEMLGVDANMIANKGAAASGNMALLLWLHARGVTWTEAAFREAAEGGSEEVLEWLVELGCSMGATGNPYIAAASNGDLSTLRCLRRLGCPWGHTSRAFFAGAAETAPLPVLRGLLDAGCPVDWEEAALAAGRRRRGSSSMPALSKDGGAVAVQAWLVEERQRRASGAARSMVAPM